MSDVYRFHAGDSPLLISVPHDGRKLPPDIAAVMTTDGRDLPDTDWHVARLYDFARELGASLLVAEYSRYVVDLNRPPDDEALYPGQLKTGICPTETFAGDALYTDASAVTDAERKRRIGAYWTPYHERLRQSLGEIRHAHGTALLWDAHSIPSRVPRLFDGELPALNIGTDNGRSCPQSVERAVADVARGSSYSTVVNARFRGGYITRHYGDPDAGCFAVQLELAQRCYMDEVSLRYEKSLAAAVIPTLRSMLKAFTTAGRAAGAGASETAF
jgi:N-formylglutamate amidohydrolase